MFTIDIGETLVENLKNEYIQLDTRLPKEIVNYENMS